MAAIIKFVRKKNSKLENNFPKGSYNLNLILFHIFPNIDEFRTTIYIIVLYLKVFHSLCVCVFSFLEWAVMIISRYLLPIWKRKNIVSHFFIFSLSGFCQCYSTESPLVCVTTSILVFKFNDLFFLSLDSL